MKYPYQDPPKFSVVSWRLCGCETITAPDGNVLVTHSCPWCTGVHLVNLLIAEATH